MLIRKKMAPSLRTCIFLWISVGFLSLSEKSEACQRDDFSALCEFVFRDVCYDFVGGSKTWSQARSTCEEQGGELLKGMNSSVKVILNKVTQEKNTSSFTWWLGDGVWEEDQPIMKNGDNSTDLCTYMKLKPLQLVKSDCNQTRGFLCTYILQPPSHTKETVVSNHATRSRLKRNQGTDEINVPEIVKLVQETKDTLRQMELTAGEPTNENRVNFLQNLLNITQKLTGLTDLGNQSVINEVIKCSSAILLLTLRNCDTETNPVPATFFEEVNDIIRRVSLLLGLSGQNEFVVQHSTGTFYQTSFVPTELNNIVLGSEENGEFIKLPSYSALKTQLGNPKTIITQMSTFSDNPHPSTENISGTVCSLQLSDGIKEIKLSNLSEMIEIFLPRPRASGMMNSTTELENNTALLASFNVSDPLATIFFSVEPSASVSLTLALSYGSRPNVMQSKNSTNTAILSPKRGYRWMITPEMLHHTFGTWYVDARLYNSTWEPGLTVKITSFTSKCLFWNAEKKTWSSDGCRVGEKSTPERTQCLCNHLTLFGSSFFVMPNYIDVSRTAELFATVSENYVVLALLCAFFGLYLITLLWACYADWRARSKRKMTLLEDNHPGAPYNYLISVQTGHRKNAGTSAKVTLKLIGSEGESYTHNLTDPDKPVLERGAVDVFLLATPFPLGEVRNLRLQHDNSGGHPSWYVNKVTIQDLQNHQVWHFFCGCWLSADRGDGVTKKTFNAAKTNEIASFRNIFQTRTSTGFRDEHIWVSVVDPPSRSPFTRAQRVSCCMSLLLCTMAINIAFWNLPEDESSPVIFSLGTLHITWQDIMVGVESGLLMFPINILIITIFRSIRPRIVKNKTDDPERREIAPAVTIPSLLKDTEEVISLVSKSTRNKMSPTHKLESTADLLPALDSMHVLIQLMQGETQSDSHWVYCSRFVLAGLCHLLMCLEKVDEKNFQSPQEYQQVLSLTNLLVRKAEMVFSSHLASCPPPVQKKKKSVSSGCWLPWWCVFLGWFLLLSISGISTFFTLLYGLSYGKDKSIKWVMSLGLSLFQSIFILQPLKVLGIAVFFALLLKPVAVEETEEVELVLLEQQDKCRRYTGRDTL